jgi:hypothetical protein
MSQGFHTGLLKQRMTAAIVGGPTFDVAVLGMQYSGRGIE